MLVFNKLEPALQRKVVSEMYERSVPAGEILIKEGDSGLAASELYVVKTGKFEVRLAQPIACRTSCCVMQSTPQLLVPALALQAAAVHAHVVNSNRDCAENGCLGHMQHKAAALTPHLLLSCCRCCNGGKASTFV